MQVIVLFLLPVAFPVNKLDAMDDLYDSCEEVSALSDPSASEIGDAQYLDHSTEAGSGSAGPLGYTTLTPDHLQSVQEKALANVAGVLACSQGIARTLLIYFRWNEESLFGAHEVD